VRLTNQKSTCSGNVDQLKLVNRDMRALGFLEIINLENTIFKPQMINFMLKLLRRRKKSKLCLKLVLNMYAKRTA